MMVLTADERKMMVSILRRAKEQLGVEKGCGICLALAGQVPDYEEEPLGHDEKGEGKKRALIYKSICYLMRWVDNMLGDDSWLTSWLARRGFLGESNLTMSHYRVVLTDKQERKLLATRKAWIAWMIKELKEGR